MANIYTQVGEEWTADVFDGTTAPPANYFVGWGTGAGTAAKGDTDLFTPASESRAAAAKSQPVADKNQFVATLTADANKTITNVGLWTASSGGTLVVHADHAGVVLIQNDQIQYTITLEWT